MRQFVSLSLLLVSACQGASQTTAPPACAALSATKMAKIPAGKFTMGDNPRYPEEGPPRTVRVPEFWIDTHEVTVAQFSAFVAATGYKTLAERAPPPLTDAPPEMLIPGSAVFTVPHDNDPRWWRWVVGAQWRHPSGPQESVVGKGNVPVVQIAYEDAEAYARWVGRQLPTEAQWEFAARGGAKSLPEPVNTSGQPQANYYQGVFPIKDLATDGFASRAPVGCFKPNAYGLYDMIGNVWEWTRETDPRQLGTNVIKGGSYLCAANYCARYRPAARQFQERGLGTDHIGFRLVSNVPVPISVEQ